VRKKRKGREEMRLTGPEKMGHATEKLDRAVLKRWAAEFEERTSCSGKTNGPIKVEDFGLDSKVVLFSFKKILFINITNLVYKSQDVTLSD
jgi:hypothetical protein